MKSNPPFTSKSIQVEPKHSLHSVTESQIQASNSSCRWNEAKEVGQLIVQPALQLRSVQHSRRIRSIKTIIRKVRSLSANEKCKLHQLALHFILHALRPHQCTYRYDAWMCTGCGVRHNFFAWGQTEDRAGKGLRELRSEKVCGRPTQTFANKRRIHKKKGSSEAPT